MNENKHVNLNDDINQQINNKNNGYTFNSLTANMKERNFLNVKNKSCDNEIDEQFYEEMYNENVDDDHVDEKIISNDDNCEASSDFLYYAIENDLNNNNNHSSKEKKISEKISSCLSKGKSKKN